MDDPLNLENPNRLSVHTPPKLENPNRNSIHSHLKRRRPPLFKISSPVSIERHPTPKPHSLHSLSPYDSEIDEDVCETPISQMGCGYGGEGCSGGGGEVYGEAPPFLSVATSPTLYDGGETEAYIDAFTFSSDPSSMMTEQFSSETIGEKPLGEMGQGCCGAGREKKLGHDVGADEKAQIISDMLRIWLPAYNENLVIYNPLIYSQFLVSLFIVVIWCGVVQWEDGFVGLK